MLDFIDGLNVVAGASDTGKSYAVSCLDYLFGASKPPRTIAAARGYDTLMVTLTERASGHRFEIERTLAGGEVVVRQLGPNGETIETKTVGAKHDGDNAETLSGHLLTWCGLWGKQLRKNAKGERRTLSFRDLAFLIVVDEERIIAERPPHLSGQPQDRTLEGDALRLLATGEESGRVITPLSAKELAGQKAKGDLVDEMLSEALTSSRSSGSTKQRSCGVERLESSRKVALSDYDIAHQSTVELEGKLSTLGIALRDVQSRAAVVEGLGNALTFSKSITNPMASCLEAIQETGRLLDALPSKACPSAARHRRSTGRSPARQVYRIEDVQLAASKEQDKITALRSDLQRVQDQLATEAAELDGNRKELTEIMEATKRRIEQELMPTHSAVIRFPTGPNRPRDTALRARAAWTRSRCFAVVPRS